MEGIDLLVKILALSRFCTLWQKEERKYKSLEVRVQAHRTKAELLQLKLIHSFARELFVMKKSQIEKTMPTFIISVLKFEY
jgi:hypothetical protein